MANKKDVAKTDDFKAKELSYYDALVKAWINSNMEKDKLIITISSAGIGFAISIIAAFKEKITTLAIIWGIFIIGVFSWIIFQGLKIFELNNEYIKAILKEDAQKDSAKKNAFAAQTKKVNDKMEVADKNINITFKAAVIMLCLFGVVIGTTFKCGGQMSEQKITEDTVPSDGGKNRAIESLQGLQQLSPENLNSLNQTENSPIVSQQPEKTTDSTTDINKQIDTTINKEEK